MSVAAAMFDAETRFLSSEARLESFLDRIHGSDGWREFAIDRRMGRIDIYETSESHEAIAELLHDGFLLVVAHPHPRSRFRHCDCRVWSLTP